MRTEGTRGGFEYSDMSKARGGGSRGLCGRGDRSGVSCLTSPVLRIESPGG